MPSNSIKSKGNLGKIMLFSSCCSEIPDVGDLILILSLRKNSPTKFTQNVYFVGMSFSFGDGGKTSLRAFKKNVMNLLKWAPHAYQCTLWLPTENTLQNYI
jgi:hypothetical protein